MFSLTYPQSSPTHDEAALAEQSYLDWERSSHEEITQYVWRRRNITLSSVLRCVISEQLSPAESEIIRKHWFDGKSCSFIAREQGVNRSSVTRMFNKAMEKLNEYLKYVVMYQQSMKETHVLPLAVRSAFAINAAAVSDGKTVGARLAALREREAIDTYALADAVGTDIRRLTDIEEGKCLPETSELIRMSAFFEVTTDYILFGETDNAGGK